MQHIMDNMDTVIWTIPTMIGTHDGQDGRYEGPTDDYIWNTIMIGQFFNVSNINQHYP